MSSMEDKLEAFLMAALHSLPYPVSQPPGGAENETYVTFNEASGAPAEHASNTPTRVKHLVQLHAFSHREDGAHRRAFFAAMLLLEKAGARVQSWGPDDYEKDTGIHHMAATFAVWMTWNDEKED